MLKAIMAVDDKGGVSKSGSMPWPKNSGDLRWFKQNTINSIVIMGRLTWIDLMMPKPLKDRVNILVTNKSPKLYPGADKYISGDIISKVKEINKDYKSLTKWVIGGPNIVNQLFNLIEEFYLTRIYGNYNCDTKIDIKDIEKKMKLYQKIENDNTCHFEIWKK